MKEENCVISYQGEEFEIIVDDPTAKYTIPRWIRQHGHDIVSIEDQKTVYNIIFNNK